MPVSKEQVPLDTAKNWAKKLKPKFGKLSEAQEAVAEILGHESWFALTKFYKNQESSKGKAVDGVIKLIPRKDEENVIEYYLRVAQVQHPNEGIVAVETMSRELYESGFSYEEIRETIYRDDRREMQELSEEIVKVRSPLGYVVCRVATNDGRRLLVSLKVN